MKKTLPKDTEISRYFEIEGKIFEEMKLPDGRILIQIVHTWGDGELMKFGFGYSDGISRTGINPLHIVGVYRTVGTIHEDIRQFLKLYSNKGEAECGTKEGGKQ